MAERDRRNRVRVTVCYSLLRKIVRWWTHDSSRRGLQRAFGALAAARADGPRHTPPPLERQLRKSGAVLGSLIVHITTYLECIRARSRSLLPTALKNERSAHHSCQKTVPTLHVNVTFDFSDENRYASAWQGTERTCKVSSRYSKRGACCARQSSRSSFRVRRGKRFVLVYTATPGRPSRTHDCSRFPCLVPRRGPCVSNKLAWRAVYKKRARDGPSYYYPLLVHSFCVFTLLGVNDDVSQLSPSDSVTAGMHSSLRPRHARSSSRQDWPILAFG